MIQSISITPVVLNLKTVDLTDEQFYRLCQANRDLQLERTAEGELVIMPPVGGTSGNREANLITDLNLWNEQVEIYHPNQAVKIVGFPVSLSGEDILPGFVLNLPL